jgi:hypothetical protein
VYFHVVDSARLHSPKQTQERLWANDTPSSPRLGLLLLLHWMGEGSCVSAPTTMTSRQRCTGV